MKQLKQGFFIFLKSSNDSVDPYDYHLLKCGEHAFTELNFKQKHSYYTEKDVEGVICRG